MDMTLLGLDYAQKSAIRGFAYDNAAKVGMTFKTRWLRDNHPPSAGLS